MSSFLYIHIPFCIRKCVYCDFLSVPYDDSLAAAYVDALCKELLMRKTSAGSLKSVYLGGGTPSILDNAAVRKLFGFLREHFSFSETIEITVEANPGTIDRRKISSLLSLGVNRISLGVQSFNDSELITLGRAHDADDAANAGSLLMEEGLKNFSLDLMYGIPGQSPRSWEETLGTASGLSPAHISSYELTPEPNTPLASRLALQELRMPDEETIVSMYHQAIDFLEDAGYEHYEISNFARQGFRCIHNLNYWDRGEYLGIGAGAHSFIDGIRSTNTENIRTYISLLNDSVLPVSASEAPSSSDAFREFIFLGLRKREGLSLAAAKALGLDLPGDCQVLVDEGYIRLCEGRMILTRKGLLIANTVILRILENLGL